MESYEKKPVNLKSNNDKQIIVLLQFIHDWRFLNRMGCCKIVEKSKGRVYGGW